LTSLNWPQLPIDSGKQPRRHRSLVLPSATNSEDSVLKLANKFGQTLKTSSTKAFHQKENEPSSEVENRSHLYGQSTSTSLKSKTAVTTLCHQFPVRAQTAHAPSLTRGIGVGALKNQPSNTDFESSNPTTSQNADQLAACFLLRQQQQMPIAFNRQMGLFGVPAIARLPEIRPQQQWLRCAFQMQQQNQYFTFGSTPSSPTTLSLQDCYSDSEPLSPLPQKFPPVVNKKNLANTKKLAPFKSTFSFRTPLPLMTLIASKLWELAHSAVLCLLSINSRKYSTP
jgi:hypothetical protein